MHASDVERVISKIKGPLMFLAVILVCFGSAYFWLTYGVVRVVVINEGVAPITSVKISYRGGSRMLLELAAGEKKVLWAFPTGESDIEISFLDTRKKQCAKKIDVYLNKQLSKRVEIRVKDTCETAWREA